MKESVSSMDLYYMIKEFQALIGSRVDKIYHRQDELMIQLYSVQTKKIYLFIKLPSTIFLSKNKLDTDMEAKGFCIFLRKRLQMGRIESIEQIKFERILKITINNKEDKYIFYIELFAPGNFILTNSDNKIISLQNSLNTKDRSLRGGIQYTPLIKEFDTLQLNKEELQTTIEKSDKDSIVKTLAVDLGFGGQYSEEICSLAKINKSSNYTDEIFNVISLLKNKKIEPTANENEIYPFSFSKIKSEKLPDSYSVEIGKSLYNKFKNKKTEQAKKIQETQVQKIQKIKSKQEKTITNLKTLSKEYQKKGELIYENYSEIKELLKVINEAKKKYSYNEIKKILKEKQKIINLDSKKQTVKISK